MLFRFGLRRTPAFKSQNRAIGMWKKLFLIAAACLPVLAFAVNYCLDCDRPIADSKTLCTRCQDKRDKANMEFARYILNGGQKSLTAKDKTAIKRAILRYVRKHNPKQDDIDIVVKKSFTFHGGNQGVKVECRFTAYDETRRGEFSMEKAGDTWRIASVRVDGRDQDPNP